MTGVQTCALPIFNFEIIGLAEVFLSFFDLCFHQRPRVAVPGDIANGEIHAFFNDELVPANVGHKDTVGIFEGTGTLILGLYGVRKNRIGLFRKGQETELRIVEESGDEMELDQYFLTQQLGPVEEDLMVLEIIDILNLEGGHAYFPDHFPGVGAELDVVRGDQRIGQVSAILILG